MKLPLPYAAWRETYAGCSTVMLALENMFWAGVAVVFALLIGSGLVLAATVAEPPLLISVFCWVLAVVVFLALIYPLGLVIYGFGEIGRIKREARGYRQRELESTQTTAIP